jgi:amino acid transporter
MLSSLGMLNSLLMSSARELYCMGDIGGLFFFFGALLYLIFLSVVLPAIFGTVHPIYRTPHVALAFLSLLVNTTALR